uniref:Variant surface glycoprotein 1125.4977 n=1 Tax=Trypanosoma brucei TaxID=5691 RepID=A0A1J0RBH7_9TRYP|nr:variant surface glycoprotein 1125.4977 [Trypanosoma brucei]
MQKKVVSSATAVIIAVGLATSFLRAAANTDAGTNAQDFAVLCGLYSLKDTTAPTHWAAALEDEAPLLDSIFNANLSTVTESWLKTKDGTLEGKEGTSERTVALQAWLKDVENRRKQKPDPNKQDTYAPMPDTPYKILANVAIINIHKRATDIAESYKKAKQSVKEAHGAAITYIKDAIYGKGKTDYDAAGMANPKTNNCGTGNTGNAVVGLSIINDLICLCAPAGAPSTKVCGQQAFSAVESNPAGGKVAAGKGLIATCKKSGTTEELTPDLIHSRLAAFYGRIGGQAGTEANAAVRFMLGLATGTGCQGSSQAKCVNYLYQLGTPGTGITWVQELESAARALGDAERAYAKATALAEQLKSLDKAAESTRQAAKTGIQLPTIATAVKPEPSAQTTKEEDCNKHQSKEKFTDPCK